MCSAEPQRCLGAGGQRVVPALRLLHPRPTQARERENPCGDRATALQSWVSPRVRSWHGPRSLDAGTSSPRGAVTVAAQIMPMLYGRDAEQALLSELLARARESRSGTLVLRGDPGVGKSALLRDARERAGDMQVLEARGVESESELPFAALHQLLRPALHHLDRVPGPQATALRGALGLAEEGPQQRFLVFAACLSLLSELSEAQPVLCLVDDAHWLDAASADALRFVTRRLDAEGIVVLFAARDGDVRTFASGDLPSLTLGGLSADAAAMLLARDGRAQPPPAVRERLIEQTGGNALALLEVPAALTSEQLSGQERLPEVLPMTRRLEGIFLERVRRLPADAQRVLLIAAADDSEDVLLVARAARRTGAGTDALDAAEQAGLLSIDGTRLEFRHPLVRSAVYDAATSSARRAAHRALAEVLGAEESQPDRRAWHLASAVIEYDDEAVTALEEAAVRAGERAGHLAAARALERAAELSADPVSRGRRLVRAAQMASLAGADEQARRLAALAEPLVEEPVLRAEIALVLGLAEIRRGRPFDGFSILIQRATEVAGVDYRKALELLVYATWAASDAGDLASQVETFKLAATIDPPEDDGWAWFVVSFLEGCGAMAEGDAARGMPLLERAIAWALEANDQYVYYWAGAGALWLGDDRRAARLAARAAMLARQSGEIGLLAAALGLRASQLFLAQQLDEARLAASEGVALARERGAGNLELLPLGVLAGVAAIRGEDSEAVADAEAVLSVSREHGLTLRAAAAIRALALVELGRGRWAEALERLDSLFTLQLGPAVTLVTMMALPDRIEAAVRAGRMSDAGAALADFETWAIESEAAWVRPRLASCRGLLATGTEATRHFEEAVISLADSRPFDRARIQLLYGEHLRRERRRTDSRVQLRAALEGFERLKAEPWTARARAELRASGATARRRDPSTLDQLTPHELQIARLVAEGLSNKEIAAQLYLSPRTIDCHLRHVFAKLEIKSRTQLAGVSLGQPESTDV